MPEQLTVPAAYYDRFSAEALFSLGSAADTIQETANWIRRARDEGTDPVRELSLKDLERFDAARAVWLQASDLVVRGDVVIEGDRETLRSAAVGCQLDVADELKGDVENETADPAALVEELMFWQTVRERFAPALTVA